MFLVRSSLLALNRSYHRAVPLPSSNMEYPCALRARVQRLLICQREPEKDKSPAGGEDR